MKNLTKLLSILFIATFLCLTLCSCGVTKDSLNANVNDFTKNWMSYLSDDTLVNTVAMPGSNDSGLSTCKNSAKTQHFDISTQLDMGVRYLELAVTNQDDQLYAFDGKHLGEKIDDVLAGVASFLKEHNKEVVILDFSGFNNSPQQKLITLIRKHLVPNGSYTYIVRNQTTESDDTFINKLTLDSTKTRGRAIVFMDGDGDNYLNEHFIFKRNNAQGTRLFSGLQSYCDAKVNSKSSTTYIDTLNDTLARYAQLNEGFCVLQGQLHDGASFFGPAYYESKHAQNMSQYVKSLTTSSHLQTVNVITRNFVDCTKCCEIVALNNAKGNLKSDKAQEFTQNVNAFTN